MWMGEKFPAVLLNHLHAQTRSAGLCTVMFQDKLFLPWTFVMQGMTPSGAYAGNQQHQCSLLMAKTQPVCILHHPTIQFPWSYRLRALLLASSSCTVLCHAIPNSSVLFLDQSVETSFHYPSWCCTENHRLQQHTVPANVRKHFFGWGLCCHQ